MRIFGMEALAFAFVVSFVARVIRTSLAQSRQIRPRSSIGDPFRRTLCCRGRRAACCSRRGRLWQDHSRPDGVNSSQRDGRNPGLQSVAPRLLEHCPAAIRNPTPQTCPPIASRRHGFGRDGVWVWSLQAQPSCQHDATSANSFPIKHR